MEDLIERAKQLRRKILDLSLETGVGHFGGSFSSIEILISLFDNVLKKEDKFILSKGHACSPLYILLREKGHNPKISEHPDIDSENGIFCTTGSLGHGLPIGVGMALARKKIKKEGNIYVLLGDGECQEGAIWESGLIASHHKLDNLTAIVDKNKLQALDYTDNVCSLGDLRKKFEAFGWDVNEIDGHSFEEIISALKRRVFFKPKMIIAHTTKGKGVSFMEDNFIWHGRQPVYEELKEGYSELE